MKRISILLMAVVAGQLLYAQQKPHYTQYILNQYIINPAITGIENYIDVKASHRHQWAGIEGNPVTTYLTVHGPIGKKDYRTTATSSAAPGANPRGTGYWEEYTAAEPHHGIGIQIVNDNTGPLSNISGAITYAYHLGLTPKTSISAGFGLGMSKWSLDGSKMDIGGIDPSVARATMMNKIRPDISAGVYLYSSDYFIGVSAKQIVPQKVEFTENTVKEADGDLVPHFFATAGYRFLAGEDFNIIPSLMIKYVDPLPVQVEANTKVMYRDLVWLGASYRTKDGFAGMIGMNVSNSFNVGYSYDYTTSGLNNYTSGSHEIIVGFLIGNRYGDTCPRNVW